MHKFITITSIEEKDYYVNIDNISYVEKHSKGVIINMNNGFKILSHYDLDSLIKNLNHQLEP